MPETEGVVGFGPTSQAVGGELISASKKMQFKKERDLTDFIDMDYNPTQFPIIFAATYNDKAIVGGDEGLEWQGVAKREFVIQLLFNDYGYHTAKGFQQSVEYKLGWLEAAITQPIIQIIDGKAITAPPVVFIILGARAFRVVILKMDGFEIMQDKNTFDPIRARVNITVRVVARKRIKRTFGVQKTPGS